MKRSEMVEEVAILFGKYIDENVSSTPRKIVDFILNEFEKKGMLPPARMRYIDCENGNTLCSEDCSWEPEDEKK